MTACSSALLAFAERILGPCDLAAAREHGEHNGHVARILDHRGHQYIAKHHTSAEKHHREVHAYQHWAPALGRGAGRLVARDPELPAILVTALPGHPCHGTGGTTAHRQAGRLLRLLHDAEPPQPLGGFQNWLDTRIGWWRRQASSLLSTGDQQLIDRHLAALHTFGIPAGGPGHFDYQPRNWLLDRNGTLRVIDFEHARVGLQARDFTRLQFRYWYSAPEFGEAFFDGYGRQLTESEQHTVHHCGAIEALTALTRGTQTGNTTLIAHGHATLRQLHQGE